MRESVADVRDCSSDLGEDGVTVGPGGTNAGYPTTDNAVDKMSSRES